MLNHYCKLKRNVCVLTALSVVLLFSTGCSGSAAAGSEVDQGDLTPSSISAETARSDASEETASNMNTEAPGEASTITNSEASGEAAAVDGSVPAADPAETEVDQGGLTPSSTLEPGMIFNTQKNELGKLVGGQPGDQTGKEARIEAYPPYYRADSYPWDYILHCTNDELRLEAVRLACAGAANDMLGYDSGDLKNTFWEEVQKTDYDPALVENPCSANCATSILTFYRCAAIRLGIDEVMDIDCTENVWMMEEVLMETGLFEKITEEDRLHAPDRNMAGDIYTAESRHTIMQVSDGKDVEAR